MHRWILLLTLAGLGLAQTRPAPNYDESKAGKYTLPSVLGEAKTAADWPKRRAEILRLYEENVHGHTPKTRLAVKATPLEHGPGWREVRLTFSGEGQERSIKVLIVTPPGVKRAPAVVSLSFTPLTTLRTGSTFPHSRWPMARITQMGFAVATADYNEVFPDKKDGRPRSVLALFPAAEAADSTAMTAWAWAMSRMLDYLLTQPDIDGRHVAVLGHSRLGKAALWAGAQDERFAAVLSNDSGEGGAAISRRWFGETVADLNRSFPHWFTDKFKGFSQSVEELPVDSHMLLALAAPRPVYVASASEDLWADPVGELIGITEAEPVYELLGAPGRTGHHLRVGKHDITEYDWVRYLRFLQTQWH